MNFIICQYIIVRTQYVRSTDLCDRILSSSYRLLDYLLVCLFEFGTDS